MSRNRGSTDCPCGFNLANGELGHIPLTSVRVHELITSAALEARKGDNCGHGWGWGFRDDLAGREFPHWTVYAEDGSLVRSGNSRYIKHKWPAAVYDPVKYTTVPAADRYRWGRVDCPECGRPFLGYYVRQPRPVDGRWCDEPDGYELYDTSYYFSFNDEPGEQDLARVRPTG